MSILTVFFHTSCITILQEYIVYLYNFTGAVVGSSLRNEGDLPPFLFLDVGCNGAESFLSNCSHRSSAFCDGITFDYADVICEGNIILKLSPLNLDVRSYHSCI